MSSLIFIIKTQADDYALQDRPEAWQLQRMIK